MKGKKNTSLLGLKTYETKIALADYHAKRMKIMWLHIVIPNRQNSREKCMQLKPPRYSEALHKKQILVLAE